MVIYPPPPSDGEEEHQVAVLFIDQLSWLSPGRMTWIGYVSAGDSQGVGNTGLEPTGFTS